jgi:hypothetical protein
MTGLKKPKPSVRPRKGRVKMNKLHLPDFKTSDERTEYIKDNADYFSITWRKDRKNVKLEYKTLETARHAASLFHKSKFVHHFRGP